MGNSLSIEMIIVFLKYKKKKKGRRNWQGRKSIDEDGVADDSGE